MSDLPYDIKICAGSALDRVQSLQGEPRQAKVDAIGAFLVAERNATALRLADWIETQRNDIPAHGWEFAGAIRELCNLDVLRVKSSLSDRQYLEKIAAQVIARNQTETAEAPAKKLDGGSSAASRGAGGVASTCPALIDNIGGE